MAPLRARSIQSIVPACLALSAVTSPANFSRDIQPLLAEHCYACHGPDAKTRKSGLRLDLREGAMSELKSGSRAIVPGDLEESEIIHRIFSKDPDEMMPPPDFRKGLNNEGRKNSGLGSRTVRNTSNTGLSAPWKNLRFPPYATKTGREIP